MALNKVSASLQFLRPSVAARRPTPSQDTSWSPNADVYATNDGIVVKVELAGMHRDDLELTVEGSVLRVRGLRRDGCRSANCRFLVMEINYGPFEAAIELPAGYDLTLARATYQNGFLRVDIPLCTSSTGQFHGVPISGA